MDHDLGHRIAGMMSATLRRLGFITVMGCGGQFLEGEGGLDAAGEDAPLDASISDDGFVDAVGDGPASADPSGIFGTHLQLWLDANEPSTIVLDANNGNRVSAWKDRSGYANDANVAYINASGRITIDPVAANGRPALAFPGATDGAVNYDGVLEAPISGNPSWPILILMVVAYDNPLSKIAALLAQRTPPGAGIQLLGNAGINDTRIYGGVGQYDQPNYGVWTSAGGWNDGKLHTIGLRIELQGTRVSVSLRADGTESSATNLYDSQLLSWGFFIGGLSDQTAVAYPLRGYVAEVLAADGATGSKQEIAALNAYFMKKYGLPF